LHCCNPKGCGLGIIAQGQEEELVRVLCSNEKCIYSSFMHSECFSSFEEQILSCLRGMSRARNWSEKQRRQNLWTKKGYDLVYKFCTCRCGKGTLRKDLNHVMADTTPITGCIMATPTSSGIEKKKKRKKSSSLSEKPHLSGAMPHKTRTRSHGNSDSVSSDNGTNYMQPFTHRTDYSVFNRLLPRHLVNGFHIKMEDDGYAAGDDTRSLVLSSLAFHRTRTVPCILCNQSLEVFDKFPLINGTFYLSPLQSKETSLEVESVGDDPKYMSAVCISCMVGANEVICLWCNHRWNGACHQIGTMYSYDIFAAIPCCSTCVSCKHCGQPVADVTKLSMSFTQLSSQVTCPHCSNNDYHFLKSLDRFKVTTPTFPLHNS
jgi:hypothetical protein